MRSVSCEILFRMPLMFICSIVSFVCVFFVLFVCGCCWLLCLRFRVLVVGDLVSLSGLVLFEMCVFVFVLHVLHDHAL